MRFILPHVLVIQPLDVICGCPVDLALNAIQPIDCSDGGEHDVMLIMADHMDRFLDIPMHHDSI